MVVIIWLLGGVLVGFYQFGTNLDISEKRRSRLRDCLRQTTGHFRLMTDESGSVPGQEVLGRTRK